MNSLTISSTSNNRSYIGSRIFRDSEFINRTEKIEAFLNTKKTPSTMAFNIQKSEDGSRRDSPIKNSIFHQEMRRSSYLSKDMLQFYDKKDNIKVSDLDKYDESQLLEVFSLK